MTIKLDVLGYRYDDEEPAFQEVEGGFYYHLRMKKRYDKAEFDATLVTDGKSFGVGEVGYASIRYVMTHESMLRSYVPPAGSAQMNVNVTKVPSGADDTGAITVTGGPTDEPIILTITTQDSTSLLPTETMLYIGLQVQETAVEVAAKIAAAVFDANFVSVAAVDAVVTFTPSAGGSIDVFTSDTDRLY